MQEYKEGYDREGYTFQKYGNYTAWYLDGGKHRVDGPAVVYDSGMEEWRYHEILHRDGGPALIDSDGNLSWYRNGQRHRFDGPAVVNVDGSEKYYLYGAHISDDLHRQLTMEDKSMLPLLINELPELVNKILLEPILGVFDARLADIGVAVTIHPPVPRKGL
jgi:hypothetical protein